MLIVIRNVHVKKNIDTFKKKHILNRIQSKSFANKTKASIDIESLKKNTQNFKEPTNKLLKEIKILPKNASTKIKYTDLPKKNDDISDFSSKEVVKLQNLNTNDEKTDIEKQSKPKLFFNDIKNFKKKKVRYCANDENTSYRNKSDYKYTKVSQTSVCTNKKEVIQISGGEKSLIPKLKHQLDRTLFSPGVHYLQDPRTRIYNFSPFLKTIIKHQDFNFNLIQKFVPVDDDESLLNAALEHKKMFYSSTSSMTTTLLQFYFLLNNYNPASTNRFNFTPFSGLINFMPSSLIITPKKNKTYSIVSDKSFNTEILLSLMGNCLETVLTTDKNEFDKFRLFQNENDNISKIDPKIYNYSVYDDFLMRSQLDCFDERLPGNSTFDIKTRAVCSIRYDSGNPKIDDNQYQIWKTNGHFESFEKEFQDLIKTGALLKYTFQARIGQMDGIFIAYHNLNTFFGFQYLPLVELDKIFYNNQLHEQTRHLKLTDFNNVNLKELDDDLPTFVGESQFKISLEIWSTLLKTIIKDINDDSQSFRLIIKSIKARGKKRTTLQVFALPIFEEQIKELQSFPETFKTGFRETLKFEERVNNIRKLSQTLQKFNKNSLKNDNNKKLLSYYITIDKHTFSNTTFSSTNQYHPYPKKSNDEWNVQFSINKISNQTEAEIEKNTGNYLNLLSVASDALILSHEKFRKDQNLLSKNGNLKSVNDLKLYSNIGRARAKLWHPKDSNPVVFKSCSQ